MVDILDMVNRKKIRHLRKEVLRLSNKEATRRAGFRSLRRWHAVESGETVAPPLPTMAAIAKVLGTTIDELME